MDFLPVVSLEQKTTHLIDYLVKVLSGVIVFGLAAIALRRKFERRYRH